MPRGKPRASADGDVQAAKRREARAKAQARRRAAKKEEQAAAARAAQQGNDDASEHDEVAGTPIKRELPASPPPKRRKELLSASSSWIPATVLDSDSDVVPCTPQEIDEDGDDGNEQVAPSPDADDAPPGSDEEGESLDAPRIARLLERTSAEAPQVFSVSA